MLASKYSVDRGGFRFCSSSRCPELAWRPRARLPHRRGADGELLIVRLAGRDRTVRERNNPITTRTIIIMTTGEIIISMIIKLTTKDDSLNPFNSNRLGTNEGSGVEAVRHNGQRRGRG